MTLYSTRGAPPLTLKSDCDVTGLAIGRSTAVVGCYDRRLRVHDLPSGALRLTLDGHWHGVRSVALSADERVIASGSWDKTVRLWSLPTGAPLATLYGHDGYVTGVAFSPDGERLASISWDGSLIVWKVASRALLLRLDDVVGQRPERLTWLDDETVQVGTTRVKLDTALPTLEVLDATRGVHVEGGQVRLRNFGGALLP